MNRLSNLVATVGSCFVLFSCASNTKSPASGLVISNVTVISPERAAPLEHAYVRIVDGRIAEVSESALRGATEIDGKGRFLIPGLIDSHVHLAVSPGFPAAMTAQQAEANAGVVAAALAQDPKSYLYFGFTTVVDLVGTSERTKQWNALELRPDAYFCGCALIVNGQIRLARFPGFSYNVPPLQRLGVVSDPAQRTPDAIVARIADDGAICLKTIYDSFANATPTVDEGKALVAAAHSRNLPVFLHATRKRSQAFAVAAGVDVIAHGMWREPGEEFALDDEARDILQSVARLGIGYQPTTQVIAGQLDMLSDSYLARTDVSDAHSPAFIDWCSRNQANCGGARFKNANAEARIRDTLKRASLVTGALAKADAKLLFGSDTPSDMVYTNPPGLNGRLEMDNWIAAGVSNQKLFRALTLDNARVLHLDDKLGTVAPGKTANLLLLGSNPLKSVTAYDTIETVFLHGRPIARPTLSARNAK